MKQRLRNPVGALLNTIRFRAKKQGVRFDLTVEWWLSQFSKGCAATKLPMDMPKVGCGKGRSGGPWSAHVDRIITGGDYTQENCRLVCGVFNMARNRWSDADVLRMARALVENV